MAKLNLKKEEIYDYIKNTMNFNFNKECMKTPDPEFVLELLSEILNKLMIIKKEKITKLSINEMKFFPYSVVQDKPYLMGKFYHLSKSFFQNILKIEDFSSNDLFCPNEKRFKFILSNLIHYHKFINEEKQFTKKNKSDFKFLIENLKNSENELNNKSNELDALIIEKQNEKPIADSIDHDIKQINKIIQETEKKIEDQHQNINLLHLDQRENEEKIKNVENLIDSNNNMIKLYKSQTVTSPEIIINLIEEQKIQILQMQNSIEELDKMLKNNEKKIQNCSFLIKIINDFEISIKAYYNSLEKRCNLINIFSSLIEEKNKSENDYINISSDIEHRSKSLKSQQEYISNYEEQMIKNYEISHEENKTIKEIIESKVKSLSNLTDQVKIQINKLKATDKKIKEKEKNMNDHFCKCIEEFEALDKTTDNLVSNINKALSLNN